MRQATVSGTIDVPVRRVFDFVLDGRNDVRWCPMVADAEQVAGDGPGVGARLRFTQRGAGTMEVETTTVEPPTTIVWTGVRGAPYTGTMRFVDLGDGRTRVRHSNAVTMPNPAAQAAWFVGAQVILRVQLRALNRELSR